MAKDNKEVVFQIISALLLVISLVLGDKFFLLIIIIPLVISIIFWYKDNVKSPIQDLSDKVKSLQKDLNTRREIESIKMEILKIKNKRGALDPATFIILLVILAMIVLYLKDKGFFG